MGLGVHTWCHCLCCAGGVLRSMQGVSGSAALDAAHAAMEVVHTRCEQWMALYQAPYTLLGETDRRLAPMHACTRP